MKRINWYYILAVFFAGWAIYDALQANLLGMGVDIFATLLFVIFGVNHDKEKPR